MFEDFVGIFDDVFTEEDCLPLIEYFENLKSMNLVYSRQDLKDATAHNKQDETAFPLQHDFIAMQKKNPVLAGFLDKFWKCYNQYVEKYSILGVSGLHSINSVRIQKTLPGEGYHVWHYESMDHQVSHRVVTWIFYLNDVEHGGETEFLYLKRRIAAKKGRLIIWPAAFTHTHRGNPPLSGDKYIMTGWLEFIGKAE